MDAALVDELALGRVPEFVVGLASLEGGEVVAVRAGVGGVRGEGRLGPRGQRHEGPGVWRVVGELGTEVSPCHEFVEEGLGGFGQTPPPGLGAGGGVGEVVRRPVVGGQNGMEDLVGGEVTEVQPGGEAGCGGGLVGVGAEVGIAGQAIGEPLGEGGAGGGCAAPAPGEGWRGGGDAEGGEGTRGEEGLEVGGRPLGGDVVRNRRWGGGSAAESRGRVGLGALGEPVAPAPVEDAAQVDGAALGGVGNVADRDEASGVDAFDADVEPGGGGPLHAVEPAVNGEIGDDGRYVRREGREEAPAGGGCWLDVRDVGESELCGVAGVVGHALDDEAVGAFAGMRSVVAQCFEHEDRAIEFVGEFDRAVEGMIPLEAALGDEPEQHVVALGAERGVVGRVDASRRDAGRGAAATGPPRCVGLAHGLTSEEGGAGVRARDIGHGEHPLPAQCSLSDAPGELEDGLDRGQLISVEPGHLVDLVSVGPRVAVGLDGEDQEDRLTSLAGAQPTGHQPRHDPVQAALLTQFAHGRLIGSLAPIDAPLGQTPVAGVGPLRLADEQDAAIADEGAAGAQVDAALDEHGPSRSRSLKKPRQTPAAARRLSLEQRAGTRLEWTRAGLSTMGARRVWPALVLVGLLTVAGLPALSSPGAAQGTAATTSWAAVAASDLGPAWTGSERVRTLDHHPWSRTVHQTSTGVHVDLANASVLIPFGSWADPLLVASEGREWTYGRPIDVNALLDLDRVSVERIRVAGNVSQVQLAGGWFEAGRSSSASREDWPQQRLVVDDLSGLPRIGRSADQLILTVLHDAPLREPLTLYLEGSDRNGVGFELPLLVEAPDLPTGRFGNVTLGPVSGYTYEAGDTRRTVQWPEPRWFTHDFGAEPGRLYPRTGDVDPNFTIEAELVGLSEGAFSRRGSAMLEPWCEGPRRPAGFNASNGDAIVEAEDTTWNVTGLFLRRLVLADCEGSRLDLRLDLPRLNSTPINEVLRADGPDQAVAPLGLGRIRLPPIPVEHPWWVNDSATADAPRGLVCEIIIGQGATGAEVPCGQEAGTAVPMGVRIRVGLRWLDHGFEEGTSWQVTAFDTLRPGTVDLEVEQMDDGGEVWLMSREDGASQGAVAIATIIGPDGGLETRLLDDEATWRITLPLCHATTLWAYRPDASLSARLDDLPWVSMTHENQTVQIIDPDLSWTWSVAAGVPEGDEWWRTAPIITFTSDTGHTFSEPMDQKRSDWSDAACSAARRAQAADQPEPIASAGPAWSLHVVLLVLVLVLTLLRRQQRSGVPEADEVAP